MAAIDDLMTLNRQPREVSAPDPNARFNSPSPQTQPMSGLDRTLNGSDALRTVYNAGMALPASGLAVRAGMGVARGVAATSTAAGKLLSAAAPIAPYAPVIGGYAALSSAGASPAAPTPTAAPAAAPAAAAPPPPPVILAPGAAPQGMGPAIPDEYAGVTLNGSHGAPVEGAGAGVRKFVQDGKTTYSNVADGANNTQLASAKPGVQTVPGAAGAQPAAQGAAAALSGGDDGGALYAARLAAVQRGDIDAVKNSYGAQGQSFNDSGMATKPAGDAVDQLLAKVQGGATLSAKGLALLNQGLATRTEAQRSSAATQLATARLGLDAQTHSQDSVLKGMQVKTAQQVQGAQAKLLAAKTDGEKETAKEELRALQGKYEKEYPDLFASSVIPGEADALGNKGPSSIATTDKRTGEVKITRVDGSAGASAAGAAKFETGKVYVDGSGKKAKWDGAKFVPQ